MGPRLGRVEYPAAATKYTPPRRASMGPRLGRVEYGFSQLTIAADRLASMGPRLGRVEYVYPSRHLVNPGALQWGHA